MTTPSIQDFVKAMSDVERLRIIGILTRGPASLETIAAGLGQPGRETFNHLAFLQFIGIVTLSPEAIYDLDLSGLHKLQQHPGQNERPESYTPAPGLDATSRKVLATFLNPDGTIRQIPLKPAKLRVLLNYLLNAFTPGVIYTEKEVNTIIRRFHLDTSGLRRDLIDAGLLERKSDGSQYWRPQ